MSYAYQYRSKKRTEYFTRIHYLFEDLSMYIKISLDKIRRDQQKLFVIINAVDYGSNEIRQ